MPLADVCPIPVNETEAPKTCLRGGDTRTDIGRQLVISFRARASLSRVDDLP